MPKGQIINIQNSDVTDRSNFCVKPFFYIFNFRLPLIRGPWITADRFLSWRSNKLGNSQRQIADGIRCLSLNTPQGRERSWLFIHFQKHTEATNEIFSWILFIHSILWWQWLWDYRLVHAWTSVAMLLAGNMVVQCSAVSAAK